MARTYRCDRCKRVTDHPIIEIGRIDGMGGGGVPLLSEDCWHLCGQCAVALTEFMKTEPEW